MWLIMPPYQFVKYIANQQFTHFININLFNDEVYFQFKLMIITGWEMIYVFYIQLRLNVKHTKSFKCRLSTKTSAKYCVPSAPIALPPISKVFTLL